MILKAVSLRRVSRYLNDRMGNKAIVPGTQHKDATDQQSFGNWQLQLPDHIHRCQQNGKIQHNIGYVRTNQKGPQLDTSVLCVHWVPCHVNWVALEDRWKQSRDTPGYSYAYQGLTSASKSLPDPEKPIVEGKDTTFDTDDDGGIENFSSVDSLTRGPKVNKYHDNGLDMPNLKEDYNFAWVILKYYLDMFASAQMGFEQVDGCCRNPYHLK